MAKKKTEAQTREAKSVMERIASKVADLDTGSLTLEKLEREAALPETKKDAKAAFLAMAAAIKGVKAAADGLYVALPRDFKWTEAAYRRGPAFVAGDVVRIGDSPTNAMLYAHLLGKKLTIEAVIEVGEEVSARQRYFIKPKGYDFHLPLAAVVRAD